MNGRETTETWAHLSAQETTCNPLFLGCSGGGGHNSAIDAIIKDLVAKGLVDGDNLIQYEAQLLTEKEAAGSKAQIELGLTLTHEVPVLSRGVKWALQQFSLPVLPDRATLLAEKEKLNSSQINSSTQEKKKRPYMDMLLDVYPTGYDNVAIWNILQKNDATEDLKHLIELQSVSDGSNHKLVIHYFLTKLENAAKEGKPYTGIISTQAMALSALCDVVHLYNTQIVPLYKHATPIKVHQFMTDLPTPGAVHFFNPLAQLKPNQCENMHLYGVNLNESIIQHFDLENKGFAGLHDIKPTDNPMVRPGFLRDSLQDISISTPTQLFMQVDKSPKEDAACVVEADEKVASIMLGSQAANDTVNYVAELADSGHYQKIFVFGGTAPHIRDAIKELQRSAADKGITIIPLDNQNDEHMAPIFTRSQLIIIRGGGLSVMEEMAMPHHQDQVILIHCKEDARGKLGSGISWEDGNVDELIQDLGIKGTVVRRTSVKLIHDHLERIKENMPLDEDGGALKEILNYLKIMSKENSLTFMKHQRHFRKIVNAIMNSDIDKVKKAMIENDFLNPHYASLLAKLDIELERDGMLSLQRNVKLLKLVNFTQEHMSSIKLKRYKSAKSLSLQTVSQESTIEFLSPERHKMQFISAQIEKISSQLKDFIFTPYHLLQEEKSEKEVSYSGSLLKSFTSYRLFKSSVSTNDAFEKIALAGRLRTNLDEAISEKESTLTTEASIKTCLHHLMTAAQENNNLPRSPDTRLDAILEDSMNWMRKYYPAISKEVEQHFSTKPSVNKLAIFS
jgi:hypothetical protein